MPGPLRLSPEQVKSIQLLLNAQGYSAGHVDGTLGEKTKTALADFQRRHGLDPTGEPNPVTLTALGLILEQRQRSQDGTSRRLPAPAESEGGEAPNTSAPAQGGQPAPQVQNESDQGASGPVTLDGDQLKAVQAALDQNGYHSGTIDGVWGRKTSAALADFQKRRGLAPTGIPDRPTLAALGVPGFAPSPVARNQPPPPSQPQPNASAAGMQATPVTANPPANKPPPPETIQLPQQQQPGVQEPARPAETSSEANTAPSSGPGERSPSSDRGATSNLNCPQVAEVGPQNGATGSANMAPGGQPTLAQACALLQSQGFQRVRALHRDLNGSWVGLAVKDQPVEVWIDASGNIGARPLFSPSSRSPK